jgi:hypothetical protein
MEFNLSDTNDLIKAKIRFNNLVENKNRIKLGKINNTRTITQNSALHKFFVLISFALNEMGQEFVFTGVKGVELSCMYTPELVKHCFWRPIQIALFNIESTKDINTQHINEISDVIIKFFGEKGVLIEFPDKDFLKQKD